MFIIYLIILHFRIWIQEIIIMFTFKISFEAVWHTERSVGEWGQTAPTINT